MTAKTSAMISMGSNTPTDTLAGKAMAITGTARIPSDPMEVLANPTIKPAREINKIEDIDSSMGNR